MGLARAADRAPDRAPACGFSGERDAGGRHRRFTRCSPSRSAGSGVARKAGGARIEVPIR